MKTLTSTLFLASLVSGLFACTGSGNTTRSEDPANAQPVTTSRMKIPLSATLSEVKNEGGRLTLEAVISINGALPAPLGVELTPPEGAVLVEGGPLQELITVDSIEETVLKRSYTFEGATGQFRLAVDSSAGAVGMHSEATWPETEPRVKPRPAFEPIKPIRINGMEIDKAIPLDKGGDKR